MGQRSLSVQQIQQLDRIAIGRYGVPSLSLMENAGVHVAQEAVRILGKKRNVLIVCGGGNNGGDGFVAARHLINQGKRVKIWLIGNPIQLKDDARVNYLILKKTGCSINSVVAGPRVRLRSNASALSFGEISPKPASGGRRRTRPLSGNHRGLPLRDIKNADVVVDAIFGVGLNRMIAEPILGCIHAINKHGRKILSVDIPSGLDGTTGSTYGVCIKADKTVTFSFPKKGFFINEGPRTTGKVVVVDIGIPKKLKERIVR